MSVLTRREILKLIKSGEVRITPFEPKQVGPGSIDFHLGDRFRVFKKAHKVFHINNGADYRDVTELVRVGRGGYLLIQPGELVHGITVEKISLPPYLSGRIEGRSRYARIGLLTHLSSSFMQPGSSGKQVLEIANLSPIALALHPGTPICQIILERTEGSEKYKGKFAGQSSL